MLVDFKTDGKYVVVVGGGLEGYRKALDFVEAGAKVLVVSESFSEGVQMLHKMGKLCLQEEKVMNAGVFMKEFDPKPDLLVTVTDDYELNVQLVKAAKKAGCMVYAPDNPSASDLVLPAVAKLGDIRIAISTSGKSPAMASIIRKRIEKMITPEDLFQIKLQSSLREALKKQVTDQKMRKQFLYHIIEDEAIQTFLKEGKFEEAKKSALKKLSEIQNRLRLSHEYTGEKIK